MTLQLIISLMTIKMDVSLEDYASKSNFKIRIGNPNFKGGTNVKQTAGGFHTGKGKFPHGHQSNEILDVSITVPAVEKTGLNIKRTNQLRDARERLVGRNKLKDVRELLNQKTQKIESVTDARQKLQTIRAQKECPNDARAKIESKKQQGTRGQVADFTLSRTVTNKNNNNIQLMMPCPQGNLNITKTVHVINQTPVIPRIQVWNDQYRPPEPQYTQYAAPYPAQYSTAPYSPPPPPQQPMYYQTQKQEQNTQTAVPIQDRSTPVTFSRTIVNNVPPRAGVDQSAPLKRTLPVRRMQKVSNTAGPIKSTSNYIPIIDTPVPSAKTKLSRITEPEEPTAKKIKEDDSENVISPLQGYKIVITNLASTVTCDDIIELFGAIGAMKYARLVKQGTAEVVYVRKEDAINGSNIYSDRELDGLPMVVRMVTPASANITEVPKRLPVSVKPLDALPLQLSKQPVGISKVPEKHVVDVSTLHKALFKFGSSSSSKPVTFTVNI